MSSFSTKNIDFVGTQSVAHMPTYNFVEEKHPRGHNDRNNRSKSRKKDHNLLNVVSARSILSSVDCNHPGAKKKKKIEVPEKYRSILEDLKNDRCEVIDY